MRQTDRLWNGYHLIQDDRFFKLGQDSILLSAFAAPSARARVLDLGCGNGALGVLLCERHAAVSVTGLEIQPEVAQLAQENAQSNGLTERLSIVCGDVKNCRNLFRAGEFDYLVCNPPYFSVQSGYHAEGENRRTARQEIEGTLEDFVRAAQFCVRSGGRAAFVLRPERLVDAVMLFEQHRLTLKRMRFVHQNRKKEPSAVLLELRRDSAPGVRIMPPFLVRGDDGEYTEEYREIYHLDDRERK